MQLVTALLCLILSLIFEASAVPLSIIGIGGVVQATGQGVGVPQQWVYTRLTLSSPYIVLQDAYCNNTYGVCQNYCNQPEFCRIYCTPICCTSEEQRIEFCSQAQNPYNVYKHNSTKFRFTGQYFDSGSGAGILAEDEMWLNEQRPENVGTVPIALQVVKKTFSAKALNGVFGLGRQSKTHGIVHVLHRNGYIDNAILTIAYIGSMVRHYILGQYSEQYCSREIQTVNVVGDLHWMFNAKQAAFLNHKTEEHDFRILLDIDGLTQMPRGVLNSFLESGIITPEFIQWPGEPDFFQINPKHLNGTFEFFFKLQKDLTLYSDLESIVIPPRRSPYNTSFIKVAALDPNPDRVEWIVDRVVLMKYCAFLDYDQNTIAFSPVIPGE